MKSYRSVSSRMRGSSRRRGFRLPWKRIHAEIAEEDGWDVRPTHGGLVRAFFVILLLHVVIVGGMLIYGWVNQESPEPLPTVGRDTIPGDAFGDRAASQEEPQNGSEASDPAASAVATAGNGATTEPTEPPPVDTRREPVRSGDTLASFANRHEADVADVRSLNRLGPDSGIQVGQWLLVPDRTGDTELASNPADEAARTIEVPVAPPVQVADNGTASAAGNGAASTPSADPPAAQADSGDSGAAAASGRTHKVQPGETAWGISRKYNVNVDELLRVNGIRDPATMGVGIELKIP